MKKSIINVMFPNIIQNKEDSENIPRRFREHSEKIPRTFCPTNTDLILEHNVGKKYL